jgi:DNA-binding NarL/FixJ family response regulator
MMKVLLVDDHPLIIAALAEVIRTMVGDVDVKGVGSAAAAREALAADPDRDLVLLDLKLADEDGFELLAGIRAAYPSLPVVVVSASDRASDVIRAIDLGAMGFVPKRAPSETLHDALKLVMSGGIYVPPLALGSESAGTPQPGSVAAFSQEEGYQSTPSLASLGLTPRQEDVLACLLQGMPNKEIARRINLSVETVKDHVAGVLRTLGVSSRTQAVLMVGQMMQQGGDFTSLKRPLK